MLVFLFNLFILALCEKLHVGILTVVFTVVIMVMHGNDQGK